MCVLVQGGPGVWPRPQCLRLRPRRSCACRGAGGAPPCRQRCALSAGV